MDSFDISDINTSSLKSYNILGKVFIIVFILVNIFNIFPLKINNPQWGSGISSLYVDSFSIFILGIWFLKNSILLMQEAHSEN